MNLTLLLFLFLVVTVSGDMNNLKFGQGFGNVEILIGTDWFFVCDSKWDDSEATVTCRQLGYKFGQAFIGSRLGTYRYSGLTQSLTNFTCNGTERTLQECAYDRSDQQCGQNSKASVLCSDAILDMCKLWRWTWYCQLVINDIKMHLSKTYLWISP